jgi:hypothetical protein
MLQAAGVDPVPPKVQGSDAANDHGRDAVRSGQGMGSNRPAIIPSGQSMAVDMAPARSNQESGRAYRLPGGHDHGRGLDHDRHVALAPGGIILGGGMFFLALAL